MFINREINLKSFLLWGLILFYFIFFVNLITDDRSSFSLIYLLIALTIAYLSKSKKIYIHPMIFIIGISSAIFITLNEYIFHSHQTSTDIEFLKYAKKYINQFLFVIPLIFLGTLFKYSNFNHKTLQIIILTSTLFSLIFNTYLNLNFHFDRGLLITEFKSIILYDYCIITLSLISLIFSFTLKNKWSFILILLSLLNISMNTLHGSRGAWVGIPIALILIAIYFYKSYQKQ